MYQFNKKMNMEDNNQLYVIIESDILKNNKINNTTKICYAYIQYFSNNKYGYCFLTRKKLANLLNITDRNLRKIIKILIENKYIMIIKKNNRSYLMPTINQAIRKRQIQSDNNFSDILNSTAYFFNNFNYNWLDEEE